VVKDDEMTTSDLVQQFVRPHTSGSACPLVCVLQGEYVATSTVFTSHACKALSSWPFLFSRYFDFLILLLLTWCLSAPARSGPRSRHLGRDAALRRRQPRDLLLVLRCRVLLCVLCWCVRVCVGLCVLLLNLAFVGSVALAPRFDPFSLNQHAKGVVETSELEKAFGAQIQAIGATLIVAAPVSRRARARTDLVCAAT
jgi:hypothetical protein